MDSTPITNNKKILVDTYVIADSDEASSLSSLQQVTAESMSLGDTVLEDRIRNLVVILASREVNHERFKALVLHFEKRTIGTTRRSVRFDRYVVAAMDQPSSFSRLDEVIERETKDKGRTVIAANDPNVIANRPDIIITFHIDNGIRTASVYHTHSLIAES
jgi:hypothetical protein